MIWALVAALVLASAALTLSVLQGRMVRSARRAAAEASINARIAQMAAELAAARAAGYLHQLRVMRAQLTPPF